MQHLFKFSGRAELRNEIRQLRRVPVEFAQHGRNRPDKHAGIPAKVAFAQKRFGKIDIWFFPKTHHPVNGVFAGAVAQSNRFALLDVSKPRTGPCWFDANGNQLAGFLGRPRGQSQCFLKGASIRNHVIGRQHEHGRGVLPGRDPAGAKRHRRRRVALGRFSQNIFFRESAEQFTHGRFLLDIGQDENSFTRDQAFQPSDSFLEQRPFGYKPKQLFGARPAAQRPKTFATPAGENEGVDRIGHVDNEKSAPLGTVQALRRFCRFFL